MPTSKSRVRLGRWLQDLRVSAGLTQWQVADELGYETPQYVSNWERNCSMPPIGALPTLAKLFGIKEAELVKRVYNARIAHLRAKRNDAVRQSA